MTTAAIKPAADLLAAVIKENAAQTEAAMRADLASALTGCDPLLAEVLHHALLGGGKRLRPLLTTVSAQLCGRPADEPLRRLGVAFEYLHAATLIHDDVIDHAASRRGKESVVSRYGMSAAILGGDWLHARSMHLIGSLAGPQGLAVFCAATADMVDGEFLQMRCAADPAVTEVHYLAVIGKKTAGLISAACAVGALYGQGAAAHVEALALYGRQLGMAFQIADDLLDYLGDEQATGKKTGNDFAEGKMTLPLIHALSHAAEADRNALLLCLQGDRTRRAAWESVRQILDRAGSFAWCRQRAEEEMAAGLAALACFDQAAHSGHLAVLRSLAAYVLSRDR